jgi:hypothetical protein
MNHETRTTRPYLITALFRRTTLILSTASLLMTSGPQPAAAGTIYGFEIKSGLPRNGGTINWDVQKGAVILRGSSPFIRMFTKEEIADRLAENINIITGTDIANENGAFVELDPSITRSSIRTGTTEGLVELFKEDFVSAAAGAIHFDPDPDTNMATLLTAGHFEMTRSGALNVSFDASIGTSADQLALLLANDPR